MALGKDTFLLTTFRKVQKTGKGLKSNGISNSRISGKKSI